MFQLLVRNRNRPQPLSAIQDLNLDPERRGELTPENGWHLDDYCKPLPPEPPGRPLPDGSWQAAR
jgi:hypothetical protein